LTNLSHIQNRYVYIFADSYTLVRILYTIYEACVVERTTTLRVLNLLYNNIRGSAHNTHVLMIMIK